MLPLPRLLAAACASIALFAAGSVDAIAAPTAPAIRFTKAPAAQSNVPRPAITWGQTFVAHGFTCTLDGHALTTCKSGSKLPALKTGNHTLTVTALTVNNARASASTTWHTDLIAPAIPHLGGVPRVFANAPATVFAWGTDKGGSRIRGYEHRTRTSHDWGPIVGGSHVTVTADGYTWVQFRSIDNAGNVSPWSPKIDGAQVNIDTVAPTLAPAGGSAAWSQSGRTVNAHAADDRSGIVDVTYELSHDGGPWTAPAEGDSVNITANGLTMVRFMATDQAGNSSGWSVPDDQSTVKVDATAPAVSVSGGSTSWSQGPVTISATAHDDASGVVAVWHETSTDGGSTWSIPADGDSVAVSGNGITEVRFQATDNVGNTSGWTTPADASTARIDTVAPTLTVAGGSTNWSRTAVTITATAFDTESGVASVLHETVYGDGGTWTGPEPGDTITATADGNTRVRFQAIDSAGNKSAWTVPEDESTAQIDMTAPAISVSGGSGDWSDSPITISASASDAGAGLANVVYETSDDGASWSDPRAGHTAVVTAEGTTRVRFSATDVLGNTSDWTVPGTESTAMIDTTQPTLAPGGAAGWSNVPVTVTAGASDTGSGVASVAHEISADGGTTWSDPKAGDSVTISDPGVTEVRFQATDTAGTTSDWTLPDASSTVRIDVIAPTLSPSGGSSGWSTGPVTIAAGAGDDASGVALVEHEVSADDGATWSAAEPGDAVTLTADGRNEVRFRATDNAGNMSDWTAPDADTTAHIDATAPALTWSGGSTTTSPAASITITAQATDNGAGVTGIDFETSLNGGAWSAPAAGDSVTVSADGTTQVRFCATDAAGNTSDWTTPDDASTAVIDATPPVVTPSGGSASYVLAPVTILANATDTGSGVASVVYETSADGGTTWTDPVAGSTVTVTAAGSTLVRFQATDALGNTSDWTVPDASSTANIQSPLDIQLVLDRTGSMLDDNKMTNLRTGLLQGFLPNMNPALDNVGLTVFPPDMRRNHGLCPLVETATGTRPRRRTPWRRLQIPI